MTLVRLSLLTGMMLTGQATTAERVRIQPLRGLTLIELVVVLAIVTALAAVALPNLVNARTRAQRQICIENLARIEAAKSSWAIEHDRGPDEEASEEDLAAFFSNGQFPVCPGGGVYEIGALRDTARCSLDSQGHRYDHDAAGELSDQGDGTSNGNGKGHSQGNGNGQGQGNGNGQGQGQGS